MKAGKKRTTTTSRRWRKDAAACGDDLEAEATAEAERLEAAYTKDVLARSSRPAASIPGTAPGRETPEPRGMTHTVVSSATREVVIGFDRPFTIIGERINPTGRKLLAEEMKAGDFSRVERDAIAQVEAGAHMLDVNAGIPLADEPAILARTIQLVQSLVDVPLSID